MAKLIDFIKDFSDNSNEDSFCTATFSLSLNYLNNINLFNSNNLVYNSNGSIIKSFHDNLSARVNHCIHTNPIRDNSNNSTHFVITLILPRKEAFKNSIRLITEISEAWRMTVSGQPGTNVNNSRLSSGVFVFNNINKNDAQYNKVVSLIISEHNSLIELFSQNSEVNNGSINIDESGW